ncbi:collagen alpha-1(I) chain [Sus scrofa]|uniref:collagen alpha-1(I) chain n=1 Tax=Sus scrofa TaxID=9823 RepID=UPI000A2AF484|nr:collagen alpha-1(I) chain [Sus scrofa]
MAAKGAWLLSSKPRKGKIMPAEARIEPSADLKTPSEPLALPSAPGTAAPHRVRALPALRVLQKTAPAGGQRRPRSPPAERQRGRSRGFRGVTLPGRGERLPGTAALKVTRRRGPWAGTPGRTPRHGSRRETRSPLRSLWAGAVLPPAKGPPARPANFAPESAQSAEHPLVRTPAATPRPPRGGRHSPRPAAGTIFRGGKEGEAARGSGEGDGEDGGQRREPGLGRCAGGSQDSGRHAEVRLHLEDEAAVEPQARRPPAGAPYSRCTARRRRRRRRRRRPARPPPRARQQPSGRPRPRRTRLLGSAEPHTGRAALSTGSSAGLTPPSATAAAGRVQPPLGARQSALHEAGPAAPGEWTAEHEGAARSFRQGPRLHRVARKIAGGAGEGELSPVPVRRSLLSTPSRLQLHAGGTAAATAAAAAAAKASAAAAAAAAALARRGHVTRPAGSLGAGRRARGRKRGSNGDWEPGDAERAFKGRTRRARSRQASAYAATRACRAVAKGCEGRGTRASARPSRSSFARRLGRPLPPPPPVRLFPPAAAGDWLRGSDVRVSMTYRGRGAEGEEGVDRARRAVTSSGTAAVSARVAASPAAPDAESDDCRRRTPAPSPGAEPEPPPASAPSSPGARRAGASSPGVHRLRLTPASADP